MRFFVLYRLVCVVLLLSSQRGYAQAGTRVKAKVKYDYLLYVPKDYATRQANYPLVIYLHGGSQRGKGGPDLTKLKIYGLPHLVDQGRDFEFIIASPQCPENKFWSTDNWLDSLYTELTATYHIDPKRVYLTGISMGGYGTWQTAIAYPDKFAAIMPLCGGCDDSTQVCRIRNVPIWTFHGTADDLVSVDETARLVKRLEQCGGRAKFTRLVGVGHEIQYIYKDRTLYDWLLKHHR